MIMTDISADLQVAFNSFSKTFPLEIVTGDDNSGSPILLKYSNNKVFTVNGNIVGGLSLNAPKMKDNTVTYSYTYDNYFSKEENTRRINNAIEGIRRAFADEATFATAWRSPGNVFMMSMGEKIVRIYCSKDTAKSLEIIVDNGEKTYTMTRVVGWDGQSVSYKPDFAPWYDFVQPVPVYGTVNVKCNTAQRIQRKSIPIFETLSWEGEGSKFKSLKYFYDQPVCVLRHTTVFRDLSGKEIPGPVYDRARGEWSTTVDAIGAIIVSYEPEFEEYAISYDIGKDLITESDWLFSGNQWWLNDISSGKLAPVRIFVMSDKSAQTATFERKFFPTCYPKAEKSGLSDEKKADTSNVDEYLELAGTRETVTKRYQLDEDDPEIFIDIVKTIKVTGYDEETGRKFSLKMLNDVDEFSKSPASPGSGTASLP
ncbi:MAG: hypothetical protein HQL75_00245 [Magnetococcales bacterium]|nr:hypothetical protein [Magnetococcales bacterium]